MECRSFGIVVATEAAPATLSPASGGEIESLAGRVRQKAGSALEITLAAFRTGIEGEWFRITAEGSLGVAQITVYVAGGTCFPASVDPAHRDQADWTVVDMVDAFYGIWRLLEVLSPSIRHVSTNLCRTSAPSA